MMLLRNHISRLVKPILIATILVIELMLVGCAHTNNSSKLIASLDIWPRVLMPDDSIVAWALGDIAAGKPCCYKVVRNGKVILLKEPIPDILEAKPLDSDRFLFQSIADKTEEKNVNPSNVYICNLKTKTVELLANGSTLEIARPASPDKQNVLVYSSAVNPKAGGSLISVDLKTKQKSLICNGSVIDATWLPNSRSVFYIAFVHRYPRQFVAYAYMIDTHSKLKTRVWTSTCVGPRLAKCSPNGNQIAYINNGQLHIVTTQQKVKDKTLDIGDIDECLSLMWSPDGRYFAFISTYKKECKLWIVDTTPKTLTVSNAGSTDDIPSILGWSSDKHSVFVSAVDTNANKINIRKIFVSQP